MAHHRTDVEHVAVVQTGVMVLGDVRKIVQVVRVLTRAVDVADFVLAHRGPRRRIHEPDTPIRYDQHHFGRSPLGTASHGVLELLYGPFGRLSTPRFFHLGRAQVLEEQNKKTTIVRVRY